LAEPELDAIRKDLKPEIRVFPDREFGNLDLLLDFSEIELLREIGHWESSCRD